MRRSAEARAKISAAVTEHHRLHPKAPATVEQATARRDQKKAAWQAWASTHREELTAYSAAHRKEAAARQVTYRARHREVVRTRRAVFEASPHRKAYIAEHRDAIAARLAAWRISHQEELAAYRVAHAEQYRESQRRATAIRRGAPLCGHPSCLAIGPAQLAWQTNPHVCYICGTPVWQGVNLHMDHVVPVSRGGVHCADNLRPACGPCNHRKYNKLLTELAA